MGLFAFNRARRLAAEKANEHMPPADEEPVEETEPEEESPVDADEEPVEGAPKRRK